MSADSPASKAARTARLDVLSPELLRSLQRGIEKESLRVDTDGQLAATPHPAGLGSALTHPHITTDFSEAQLELITGVHSEIDATLQQLTDVHQFVYDHIGDETMWAASMPCRLPDDDKIPVGQYGSANVALAKTVYRKGLGNRYGRRMQTISGLHYNFSLPDGVWPALQQAAGKQDQSIQAFKSESYFSLIRNFRRHSWLLLLLTGASPAICGTFLASRGSRHAVHADHRLEQLSEGTFYLPYGTSLRMGPLGYQSAAQASLKVSYNNIGDYAESLRDALTRPWPEYETLGIRDEQDYHQLSTGLLQIENEFYGTIRPKRTINSGERALHALLSRGVEYVEVRCMDLDPFSPIGIEPETIRLLDVFLLHCLLSDAPPDTETEHARLARNQLSVVAEGRRAGVLLEAPLTGDEISANEWGHQLLEQCELIASRLDLAHGGGSDYLAAIGRAHHHLDHPELTLSARVLDDVASHGQSYFQATMAVSTAHRATLRAGTPTVDLSALSAESVARQKAIEAADTVDFETYRAEYIAQALVPEPASASGTGD